MPVPTTQEMLDAIDGVRYALMTGGAVKTYSIDGRMIDRFSPKELSDLQHEYRMRLARETDGANRTFAGFADPRRSSGDDQ